MSTDNSLLATSVVSTLRPVQSATGHRGNYRPPLARAGCTRVVAGKLIHSHVLADSLRVLLARSLVHRQYIVARDFSMWPWLTEHCLVAGRVRESLTLLLLAKTNCCLPGHCELVIIPRPGHLHRGNICQCYPCRSSIIWWRTCCSIMSVSHTPN